MQQTLDDAQQADRPLSEQAEIQHEMTDWSLKWGQDDDARRTLEGLLDAFQDIDAPQQEAETLNRLGLLDLRQGRHQAAEQQFLAAQTLQEAHGDQAGKAKTLNNRALGHYMRGELEKAKAFFEQALEGMRTYQDHVDEATVLNHLALVAYQQARGHEAEGAYEAARPLYNDAIESLEAARALLAEHSHRPTEGTIINNLGLVFAGQGHNAEVRGEQEEAQSALTQAIQAYSEALGIIRDVGGKAAEGATLHNIGELHARLGQPDAALDALQQALHIEREIGNRIDEARTLSDMGYLHEQQDDTAQALDLYLQSLDAQESLRTAARLEEFKISLAAQAVDVYQRAFRLARLAGDVELAFELSERSRARTFLDMMGNARVSITQGVDADLLHREQRLRDELADLYARLREEKFKPLTESNIEEIDALKADIAETQQAYEAALIAIKANAPEYASLIAVNPLPLPELQAGLDDDVTLLAYYVTADATTIFAITRTSVSAVDVAVTERELFDAIVLARRKPDAIDAPPPESLERLHDWLIAPVRAKLNTPVVGIIPHGLLHYAPFAALRQSDAYFGDEFLLFSLPSASVRQFIHPNVNSEQEAVAVKTLAMAFKGYEPKLPSAEKEAQGLADIYTNIDLLIGEHATEAAFKQHAGEFSFLHLSAHALLNGISPFLSGILLYDGLLEVHELYGLSLDHADLAVLSACNTTIGEQFGSHHRGREIVALNRAFLYAGASSVVASLWSVDDEATYHFMLAFHTALAQGLSKAEALQQARRETRKHYPHPRYWAAFVLTGDPGQRREPLPTPEPAATATPRVLPTAVPSITAEPDIQADVTATPMPENYEDEAERSNRLVLLTGGLLLLSVGGVAAALWRFRRKKGM